MTTIDTSRPITPTPEYRTALLERFNRRQPPGFPEHRLFRPMQVIEIRRMHRDGMTMRDIARWFGVSDSTIRDIVRHKTYQDVVEEGQAA